MKRNLFDELNEGFAALKSEREGKITLKHHTVDKKPELTITRIIKLARTTEFVANRIRKIPAH